MSSVVVVGQGYVGLPMALRAAMCGHAVVGFDTNQRTVERLNGGLSHIDDVSNEELASALQSRSYAASSDPGCLADAEVIVVCVPTPLGPDGGPDLRAIESAAEMIAARVKLGAVVILESTTYPGTTEEVFAPIVTRKGQQVGTDVNIAFSPERIDPGNETFTITNTPKVVGGLTPQCTRRAAEFYATFVDEVVEAKGAREAEMAKLLENTFRHVNIALVNEMVRFSRELEVDLWDAIRCAASKPFGFMAFWPGPGVGGHCIPVDPSYLSHQVKARLGYAFRMVELAEEINTAAPLYVADRVWQSLNQRRIAAMGAKVLLLGVAYKANISDERESPAVPLARRLMSWGVDVTYHDPNISTWTVGGSVSEPLTSVSDLTMAVQGADLVVLLQEHREYSKLDFELLRAHVLDTRASRSAGNLVEHL